MAGVDVARIQIASQTSLSRSAFRNGGGAKVPNGTRITNYVVTLAFIICLHQSSSSGLGSTTFLWRTLSNGHFLYSAPESLGRRCCVREVSVRSSSTLSLLLALEPFVVIASRQFSFPLVEHVLY